MVLAEAGVITAGRAAIAIGHQQAAVAQAEEVGREAPDADRPGNGPRLASVGRFALERLPFVWAVVVADMGYEAAVGCFNGIQLVILRGVVPRAGGNAAEPLPCQSIVGGDGKPDILAAAGVAFASVEQPAIGELNRAVGVGQGNAIGARPGHAAIRRAKHPRAEQRLALSGGGGALNGLPTGEAGWLPVLGGGEQLFVRERGERVEQQGAGGGLAEAGVAVVDGRIHRDLRPGPGAAIVKRTGEFKTPEGAHVMLTPAGICGHEFAGAAADERWPGVIITGLVGDGLDGLTVKAGSGEEKKVAAGEHR